jgi:sterol O-acyltransferase
MTFLGGTIAFAFFRDWEWPQTVFILLHSLVLLMKQHSYAFYTGWLSLENLRLARLQAELSDFDENITPDNGHRGSIIEESQRLVTEIENSKRDLTGQVLHKVKYPDNLTFANFLDYMLCPTLVYELEYPRTDRVRVWYVLEKAAATFGSIALMVLITEQYVLPAIQPILPPRTEGMTVSEKFVELGWVLLDMLFPYRTPPIPNGLGLTGRFITLYLLAFYVIFECVLNVFAEITRFADRGFYDAWWNSTTWDQVLLLFQSAQAVANLKFAREWNKPVHLFLLRHVYHSSISAFSISKTNATFITFFLSACVHELLMACMFHRLRGYLLILQVCTFLYWDIDV